MRCDEKYGLATLALLVNLACMAGEPLPTSSRQEPVTNGSPTVDHPGVVALVDDAGAPLCSGVLIAPHTILTAAHCALPPHAGGAFFGPSLAQEGKEIAVAEAVRHPDFDIETYRNDLGLVTLRAPAPTAPVPLDERTVDAAFVGATFVVVGFGATAGGVMDWGTQRIGTAVITSVADVEFDSAGAPSQPCAADSGGPALFDVDGDLRIGGIVSRGDADCVEHAFFARVDVARATFIEPYLAATGPNTAQAGEPCLNDAQCADGPCLAATDEPDLWFCSRACESDDDCPAAMECANDECRHPTPSPGAIGWPCATGPECASGICWIEPDDPAGVCARDCTAADSVCPEGDTCTAVDPPSRLCLPETGCRCATSAPAGSGVLALIVAGLLTSRGRRPRGASRRPR